MVEILVQVSNSNIRAAIGQFGGILSLVGLLQCGIIRSGNL